jgi:hypothetical protein
LGLGRASCAIGAALAGLRGPSGEWPGAQGGDRPSDPDRLIDALAEVRPGLSGLTVQQALPQRAEEILTGNGLAGVRETAIAPLRR